MVILYKQNKRHVSWGCPPEIHDECWRTEHNKITYEAVEIPDDRLEGLEL